MSVQGPRNCATASGVGWTNSANIEGNSSFATQSIPGTTSGFTSALIGTNFGFSIPAGATINGIQVSLVREVSSTTNFTANLFGGGGVQLLKAGVAVGAVRTEVTNWTTSPVTTSLGTTSDLWGTTWTAADINAVGFGAQAVVNYNNSGAIPRTLSVNNYLITVTYTIGAVAPTVVSCSPSSGDVAGGTLVTIGGTGFTGTTGVTFGGSSATSVSVSDDSTLTCITPSHAVGAVDVVVTTPSGSGTLTNGFTYTSSSKPAWQNPDNSFTTGASYATVALTSQVSQSLMTAGPGFSIPAGATISGVSVAFKASYSGSGSPQLQVQLENTYNLLGTAINVPLSAPLTPYTQGSSSYLWGASLDPALLNSAAFGVSLTGTVAGGTGTISVNSLVITVYYTTSAGSGALLDQGFGFSVSLSTGVSGFGVSFKAYSDSATILTLQLLQNGNPVGTPKDQALTTIPTIYSLGSSNDSWGYLWSAGDINSNQFGVQITAAGNGTSFVNDLDIIVYITAALENFNFIGSFEQNNTALTTLALDAAGNLWKEDVNSDPGVLSLVLSGLIPNSFAKSAPMNNLDFLMFSDLSIGTDRPRLYDGQNFYPVTQVGPGAPPSFQANIGSVAGIITLSSFTFSGGVATFSYTPPGSEPSAGGIYVLSVPGSTLDKQVVTVLSSGLSPTQFEAEVSGSYPAGPTSITGTATPTFAYGISSITQYPQYAGMDPSGLIFLLSSAPSQVSPGNNVTVYYNNYPSFGADTNLVNAFNSGNSVFVEITGAVSGGHNFNGIWLVTSVGQGFPAGHDTTHTFFTFTYTTSGSFEAQIAGSVYRQTIATLTVSTPIPGLSAGSPVTITGATPTGWNGTWTIVEAKNGGAYNITSTAYDYGTHIATYGWSAIPPSPPPTAGNLITVINCTNNAIFNGTFVINSVAGAFFTVANIVAPAGILPGDTTETQAQATEFGTVFTFDPGETFQGTTTNVIYGNDSGTGKIAVIGSSLVPIGAGTRQAICFFITKSGNRTPASPPITFTVSSNANELNVSNIPIGPPDVIARGIAITEAGQNGVAGANFYVIPQPVVNTVNGVTTTYTSTVINDNTSTSASFSFTDQVLLNSEEVDIQGNNLFNLIELGSSAWCIPYSGRMFYGLQLNKVDNFNNLSFDGGYLPNPSGTILPLGWGAYPIANEITLITSPVTGMSLYISNTTGSIQSQMGILSQSAYQDAYKVAIIAPNAAYSIRVACSCPSGIRLGTLVFDLVDLSGGIFGAVYGSFSVPLQSMTTLTSVFSGPLLAQSVFSGANPVSSNLQLRLRVTNMGIGADVQIDRIEVYPTAFPYLKTEVYGSYVNKPESIDASGDGGILDTSGFNPQPVMGAFVLRDSLYLLKTGSLYSTRDNPNSEPGGWSITEVSNRVGAIGINAYNTGDEWAVMANRSGIYGFEGSIPGRLTEEIFQVWEAINWDAGNTIVLRNDIVNRRMYCAIPLPTGISPEGVPTASITWLPNAPYNPKPTTPNVMLMLNYQALGSFGELVNEAELHTTMFGTLAVQDMKRKWTIWQIPSPYMDFITRQNYNDAPIFICNGIGSSKIYKLDPQRHDDDGAVINSLYCTYSFVNAAKAVTMPLFGMHAKRYTILQVTAEGFGKMTTKMYANTLIARYPYTVPVGINLEPTEQDDFFRPINIKANRMFLEFSTSSVGAWFQLHKILLTGKADPWSSLNPTGGGNNGVV